MACSFTMALDIPQTRHGKALVSFQLLGEITGGIITSTLLEASEKPLNKTAKPNKHSDRENYRIDRKYERKAIYSR